MATVKHFTSWVTLAPDCKISGGKVLSSHTRKTSSHIAVALRLAAVIGGRSNTALGAFYGRLAARIGKAESLPATAVGFYAALSHGLPRPQGDHFDQRYRDRVIRQFDRLAAQFRYLLDPQNSPV